MLIMDIPLKHVGDSGFVTEVYKSAHLPYHNTPKTKWNGLVLKA